MEILGISHQGRQCRKASCFIISSENCKKRASFISSTGFIHKDLLPQAFLHEIVANISDF